MSDNSISIIPKKSVYQGNEKKAQEILEWLISLDIVKPLPSDCVLGAPLGYPISNGAIRATNHPNDLPFSLITNGLEIVTSRQIFDNGGNGVESIICPTCSGNLADEDWAFFEEWQNQTEDTITCTLCQSKSSIHSFHFTPTWGFSNLGFTFWNWSDLTNEFIESFKDKLNSDVDIVYRHL